MIAGAFARLVGAARRSGAGYIGHCPAHGDERESLAFRDGARGLVVRCHAGCSAEAIMTALGLRVSDLFNDEPRPSTPPRVVAEYRYESECGKLCYIVERREPKDFRQRRPDGRGGWIWNLDGVRRVLYRLPELRSAMAALSPGQRVAYLPEGEKDVETLRRDGLPATTNAGGADAWRDEYATQLQEASVESVVVLRDNDRAGEARVPVVVRSCLAAGLTVKAPRLPGLGPGRARHGEDVSDWRDAGHTREELLALVDATSEETQSPEPQDVGFRFRPVADLLAEWGGPREFLVDGLLPREGISTVVGRPKAGKTTFCRSLAAAVVRGEPFLGHATTRGPVLYCSFEDSARAVAAHFERLKISRGDPLYVHCGAAPVEDPIDALRREVERLRPVLLIIDTVFRLSRVRSVNDYSEVLAALDPLLRLARELRVHVLLVHHAPKGCDARDASDAPLGSVTISGTVDVIVVIKRAGDRRTMTAAYRAGAGEDLPETLLQLDATGAVALGATRGEADEEEVRAAILDYLGSQTKPVEEQLIHEFVGGRRAAKQLAVRRLIEAGEVARTGAGRRGDPYLYILVPKIPRVPENQKAEKAVSPRFDRPDSGTREIAPGEPLPDSRVPVSTSPARAHETLAGHADREILDL